MTDLQVKWCRGLVGILWARSNTDCEGLCKYLGTTISGKKQVALGRGLSVALARNLTLAEENLDAIVNGMKGETEETDLEILELVNRGKLALFKLALLKLKEQPFYRFL